MEKKTCNWKKRVTEKMGKPVPLLIRTQELKKLLRNVRFLGKKTPWSFPRPPKIQTTQNSLGSAPAGPTLEQGNATGNKQTYTWHGHIIHNIGQFVCMSSICVYIYTYVLYSTYIKKQMDTRLPLAKVEEWHHSEKKTRNKNKEWLNGSLATAAVYPDCTQKREKICERFQVTIQSFTRIM